MTKGHWTFRGHFPGHFRKGRAMLPKNMRHQFTEGKAYAIVDDEHLDLYPTRPEKFQAELPIEKDILYVDPDKRDLLGIVYIIGRVTFVGMEDHVEIWDPNRLKAFTEALNQDGRIPTDF